MLYHNKYFVFVLLFVALVCVSHAQTRPHYLQINDSVAYPEQYGAVANDASAATANAVAFSAALAAKKTVVVADTFYIGDTIELTANQALIGVPGKGALRSTIDAAPLLNINGNSIKIKDLVLYGQGDYSTEFIASSSASVAGEDGIYFTTGLNCSIERCEIRLFKGHGVGTNDTQNSKINLSIEKCFIKNNFLSGVYLGGVNSAFLSSCDINFNRGYNLYCASSSNSIVGESLELGVASITNTVGGALYSACSSGRNSFTGLHIEDESASSYYVATASRLICVNLVSKTTLDDSYVRVGSGWIYTAISAGAYCEVNNTSLVKSVYTPDYPVAGVIIANISSSVASPKLNNISYSNFDEDIDDTGTNGYKHYKDTKIIEVTVPYLFDCNGTAVASMCYSLPFYTGSRRLYAANLVYANMSTSAAFSNGDFKIGTTEGASDIFISTGTTPLEVNRVAGITKSLGLTDGEELPAQIFITLQQRSGQTLRFWLRFAFFN